MTTPVSCVQESMVLAGQSGPGDCAPHSLERIDQLIQRILHLARTMHFGLAQSSGDLEAAMRLRFRTAVSEGWIAPGGFPSGLERDHYDDDALQIVALACDTIVGTTRIVLPASGRRLPTEEAFAWQSGGLTVDVGRTCVDAHYRRGDHLVFLGLLGAVWIEMRKCGFTQCCGALNAKMILLYKRLGFEASRTGPPHIYWGEERWPVLVRPQNAGNQLDESIRRIEDRRSK